MKAKTNSGNEVGPFKTIEESTLAHLTEPSVRSDIFAWYVVLGTVGMALGSTGCGWFVQIVHSREDWTALESFRVVFFMYAGLGVAQMVLALFMSERCEQKNVLHEDRRLTENEEDDADDADSVEILSGLESRASVVEAAEGSWSPISLRSRPDLIKMILLFALNSVGSGMVPL